MVVDLVEVERELFREAFLNEKALEVGTAKGQLARVCVPNEPIEAAPVKWMKSAAIGDGSDPAFKAGESNYERRNVGGKPFQAMNGPRPSL